MPWKDLLAREVPEHLDGLAAQMKVVVQKHADQRLEAAVQNEAADERPTPPVAEVERT